MRVLLTGATGFIGSHVLDLLLEDGHQVACVMRKGSDPWRIVDHLPKITVLTGDLSTLQSVTAGISTFEPQAVIHLAWQGVGNRHRDDPRQSENIPSSLALMEHCASVGARVWIALGSQVEYGPCDHAISESTPTKPTNAYGIAKLAAGIESGVAAKRISVFVLFGFVSFRPMVPKTILRG